jgi:hypothetical protein
MALGELAQLFAAEIKQHDWSDANIRADRAGHRSEDEPWVKPSLYSEQAERVRLNVLWVVAQVLGYAFDPNLDIKEFAEACGHSGIGREATLGWLENGLRRDDGRWCRPGTLDDFADTTTATDDR